MSTINAESEVRKRYAAGAKLTARIRYEHLELAVELAREQNEMRFFEGALDLPQALAAKAKRRVVVAFDEFQASARLHLRIFDIMRTRFQTQRAVAYAVLLGRRKLGRGLAERVQQEQRIVAEAIGAARCSRDLAAPDAFGDERPRIFGMAGNQGNHPRLWSSRRNR